MEKSVEINYKFLALYIGCECEVEGRPAIIDGFSSQPEIDTFTATFTDGREENDWCVYNDLSQCKLKLRPFESLTEDEWQGAWMAVGGTPHLYSHGIDEMKDFLEGYTPDGFSMQFDYFTMAQLINYFRSIWIDCDDLINSGLAIDKSKLTTYL